MMSHKRKREAILIGRAGGDWQGLVRSVAIRTGLESTQALGDEIARTAEQLWDHNPSRPAPETGFCFCARCLGVGDLTIDAIRAGLDDPSDYLPILQIEGMRQPRCKQCGSNACWTGPTGVRLLADAFGHTGVPDLHVSCDDLPDLIAAIVGFEADEQPAGPTGCRVVYPHVAIGQVVRTRCGACRQIVSASGSALGREGPCPACDASVSAAGKVFPRFAIEIRCPSCDARATLREQMVGQPTSCGNCGLALLPVRQRLAARRHSAARGQAPGESNISDAPTAAIERNDEIDRLGKELHEAEQRLIERDQTLIRQQVEIEILRSELEGLKSGRDSGGLPGLIDALMEREDQINGLREALAEKEVLLMSAEEGLAGGLAQAAGVASMFEPDLSAKPAGPLVRQTA